MKVRLKNVTKPQLAVLPAVTARLQHVKAVIISQSGRMKLTGP
jgi:inactivated superfamily I helicase